MSREADWDALLIQATQNARDEAKKAGTSIVYMVRSQIIREYANGNKVEVVRDKLGNRVEIPFKEDFL